MSNNMGGGAEMNENKAWQAQCHNRGPIVYLVINFPASRLQCNINPNEKEFRYWGWTKIVDVMISPLESKLGL